MAMKVVAVDGLALPSDVDFPPLTNAEYAWEQYLALTRDDIADRCLRPDTLMSLSSPVDRTRLQKLHRVKPLTTSTVACRSLDQEVAKQRGVELLAFPENTCSDSVSAQDLCNRISEAIDHYIRNFEH